MINLPKKYSYLIKAFLSLFGIGFIPLSPGTLASAAVALGWYFTLPNLPKKIDILIPLLIALPLIYLLSIQLITLCLKPPIDKSWIVIDEVIGMIISLIPTIILSDPKYIFVSFLCFRFFDIVKPSLIKKIDALHTPESVILDDIVAGIFSAATVILFNLIFI